MINLPNSGYSRVGKMLGLGPRDRRFESCYPDLLLCFDFSC